MATGHTDPSPHPTLCSFCSTNARLGNDGSRIEDVGNYIWAETDNTHSAIHRVVTNIEGERGEGVMCLAMWRGAVLVVCLAMWWAAVLVVCW